jgi:type IV secretion system protein VirB6
MNMVTQLFQKLDTMSVNAIQTIYQSLATALLPVFTIGVTLYVVYWGYEMLYGRASLTAGAFVWRMLRIWLIYIIAFGWSTFSALVVQVFTTTGDGVATAVCTGVGGTGCSTPEMAVGNQISTVFTNGMTAAKTIAASGGWGAAFPLALLAIIDIIAVTIFVAVAITMVMIGKVALFVLLGLAPLFIAMALFDFSSSLFTGWLRTCLQYAIVPVIVYGILAFILTVMNAAVTNITGITDFSSGLTLLAPFLILCVVGVVILLQALPIAASIAGGAPLYNPFPGAVSGATRGYLFRRALRSGRAGDGFGPPLLPAPVSGGGSSTITQGANTISSGGRGDEPNYYNSPAAEQVAGALLASRVAQYRVRNAKTSESES